MKRRHDMPFGAAYLPDGGTRFRIWAPAADRIVLQISRRRGENPERYVMQRLAEGWHEATIEDAGAGSLYRYEVGDGMAVPDPASRFQPEDVHGPSEVIDPEAYDWSDSAWRGRPWHEAVFYELHVGAFTAEGSFAGVERCLDHFAELGVTAVELMPVADFPGARNWGYDGVLPFAPDGSYGRPEELKWLVDAAHGRGLMVFLDVVYNHFGPEGNYLHLYAPAFFTERHHTPWGAAINFDGYGSRTVRDFFIENALYWLEEYHFDGLRLDAVHAILDDSSPDILEELAERVKAHFGTHRHAHLVLENDHNAARYLARDDGRPRWYVAQWNDDAHHALHCAVTGEGEGYYQDYIDDPVGLLCRALTEGFAYQGEGSPYRNGQPRGEGSAHLPPTAFVPFLQNHDQVGNRAMGERIAALTEPAALRAATAILLLAPSPPLLFMGEEWGSLQPFPFFCDFGPELADSVREGRRREFARFRAYRDPAAREKIPDPNAEATFRSTVLNWHDLRVGEHREWLRFVQDLLAIRRNEIAPLIETAPGGCGRYRRYGERAFECRWTLTPDAQLGLLANLSSAPCTGVPQDASDGRVLLRLGAGEPTPGTLPAWSVVWTLQDRKAEAPS